MSRLKDQANTTIIVLFVSDFSIVILNSNSEILKTNCCSNYLCLFCAQDINLLVCQGKINCFRCHFCSSTKVKLTDVEVGENVKKYFDSPQKMDFLVEAESVKKSKFQEKFEKGSSMKKSANSSKVFPLSILHTQNSSSISGQGIKPPNQRFISESSELDFSVFTKGEIKNVSAFSFGEKNGDDEKIHRSIILD